MHSSKTEILSDSHLAISSRSLELLKWLAVGCMLLEHYCRYVIGDVPDWAYSVGRLTFPLFAFCLAVGFVNLTGDRQWQVFRRLCGWAVVAQVCSLAVDGRAYGNVLIIFALSALIYLSIQRGSLILIGFAVGAALIISMFCEFGPIGILIVLLMMFAVKFLEFGVVAIAVGVIATALLGSNLWSLLALPIILCASVIDVGPPRVRHLFYWVYALQFPFFGALAWFA